MHSRVQKKLCLKVLISIVHLIGVDLPSLQTIRLGNYAVKGQNGINSLLTMRSMNDIGYCDIF